jgi:hypothetical protein
MKNLKVRFTGTAPLMMQSDRTSDPLDDITRAIKSITGKRKKTDEDLLAIYQLEFLGGLYHHPRIPPDGKTNGRGDGVHLPGVLIDATLNGAAKLQKRGQDVKRGLMTIAERVPLIYPNPRPPLELYQDPEHRDIRGVKIGRSRVMRCRPIFREWSAETTIAYDEQILDEEDVLRFARDAGEYIGFGTYRPRFGRFSVEVL